MYLWHFVPVRAFGYLFNHKLPEPWKNDLSSCLLLLFTIISSVGLAIISNKFIEKPFIQFGHNYAAKISSKVAQPT